MLVVPYPPGGGNDVIARIVAGKLSAALGREIVVENHGGAGGTIATRQVARAAPDGYTLLVATSSLAINPAIYPDVGYDPRKDFAAVGLMATSQNVLLVNPAVAASSVAELIARAKAEPGRLTYASTGGGNSVQLAAQLFAEMARVTLTQVPYKGNAPALTDLMGGQVNILFDLYNTSLPQIRAGKIRPVALTRPSRGPPLPDVPVIAETLPGFVLVGWHGVMLPVGVPRPIVERLNHALAEALADKDVTKRITDGYSEVAPTSPEAFGEILQQDFVKYARIVKDAGIKPE
jgi:tripartite-type tricarboxylate transporter receptor subunit TctC